MALIDIDRLLAPLSAEKPCGDDLSYDAEFQALERDIEGTPERQMGSEIIPAQEPEWRDIQNRALALFERTRDLRLAVFLSRALLRQFGLAGFSEGLALTSGLVQTLWPSLYPELDAEDPAQTLRVNVLLALRDERTILNPVRQAPLVAVRALGRFGERDIAIATGELQPPAGVEPVKLDAIEAAFTQVDLAELQGTAEAVTRALGQASAIEQAVGEQVGASNGPNLGALKTLLGRIDKIMRERVARRTGAADGAEAPADGAGGDAPAARPGASGPVASREDVVRTLERIIEYYARHEPSSPLPILLRRAQRLVTMEFADIIRDIAPDAVAQIDLLRGHTDPSRAGGEGQS